MALVAAASRPSAARSLWSALTCCLDWRVLTPLATIALGVFVFRPDLFVATLPVLLLAICPLSMLLMAWRMRGQPAQAAGGAAGEADRREADLARLQLEVAELTLQLGELDRDAAPRPGGQLPETRSLHVEGAGPVA